MSAPILRCGEVNYFRPFSMGALYVRRIQDRELVQGRKFYTSLVSGFDPSEHQVLRL